MFNQIPTSNTITSRKWKCIGHTLGKNTNATWHALDWRKIKKERQKNTWKRDLTSEERIGKNGDK